MGPVRRIINLQVVFLAIVAQFLILTLATPAEASARTPAATASPTAAKPEPAPTLFGEATFLFPRGARINPRWVLPPTDKTRADAIFSVNGAGSPVLAFSGDSNFHLLYPDKQYLVAVNAVTQLALVSLLVLMACNPCLS